MHETDGRDDALGYCRDDTQDKMEGTVPERFELLSSMRANSYVISISCLIVLIKRTARRDSTES